MNKEKTSDRLKAIMEKRNLRQVDLLNKCIPYCQKYDIKMNRSDISQYVSGKVEPNQSKLAILGMALNVNESWLMGFDVPSERIEDYVDVDVKNNQTSNKRMLIYTMDFNKSFNKLNTYNKSKAISFLNKLLELQEIEESITNAAHADNYEKSLDELKKQEEDIMDDDNF